MTIDELVTAAHTTACAKGWWDDHEVSAEGDLVLSDADRAAKIALMHSELSEALECIRNGELDGRIDPQTGKPEGLPFELADVVIRIADYCGAECIDLEKAIADKMAYNRGRPYRHNGKAL